MDRKTLESLFSKIADINILVTGDLMLDEYLWGKTERISPEAPVQVVDIDREELRLGGAGNVVNNLVAVGVKVTLCSVVGGDGNGNSVLEGFRRMGVSTDAIFIDQTRLTSRKTRVVAAHQQIVRIDRESKGEISEQQEDQLCEWIKSNAGFFNVVLVSDYNKGVLTKRVLETVISTTTKHKIPLLVDPKGCDFSKYYGAQIITPNRKEAELASGIAIKDQATLASAAQKLIDIAGLEYILVTRSEEGMSLFGKDGETLHIPTVAREVFDVSGAGDTVLAALAVGVASKLAMADAAILANLAAGIAVTKLGTSTVSPEEIIDSIALAHNNTEYKIKNRDVLVNIIKQEKNNGAKVVFTNGCFDLLHAGHVKYLQKARSLGDILVLGLNSDSSIRRLKGEKRPLIDEEERANILAALDCISYLVLFDEDTPLELIKAIKPHILAKGGDYTAENVAGKDIVEAYGGRVELVNFIDGKSTTNIIEQVLKRYSSE